MNLWGADHVVVGTDYPYDMGWYDPRGFVGGAAFLKDADKAKIMGLNAATAQDHRAAQVDGDSRGQGAREALNRGARR